MNTSTKFEAWLDDNWGNLLGTTYFGYEVDWDRVKEIAKDAYESGYNQAAEEYCPT